MMSIQPDVGEPRAHRAAEQKDDDKAAVLRCTDVHKRFGGSIALRGAHLELRAGEVHALIGENGSGKSTLLNIVSGQLVPDDGVVEVASPTGMRPVVGRDADVAIVTQELSLAPDLSVAENIMMGRHSSRRGPAVSWRRLRDAARETLQILQVDIDVSVAAGTLRVDQQQMVEIARAIQQNAPILILDEPTSSLTADGANALFACISRLRDHGVAIVLVSHRLEELFEMADRFTVLRDGLTVAEGPTEDFNRTTLVHHMMGYAPEQYVPSTSPAGHDGHVVLSVRGLHVGNLVKDVGFDVKSGEALGLVGLSGSGQTEVLEALFGSRTDAFGELDDGTSAPLPRSPRAAVERGLALVPNDRKAKGLFMQLGPADNMNIARTAQGFRLRRLRRSREIGRAQEWIDRFAINGGRRRQVSELSGGNQQKVLLSKWLSMDPAVLMLDEPTRGVDVVAKAEIHRIIHETRDAGTALVISSSEIDELLLLCDRFLVLFRGRVVGCLTRSEATEARLTHMATEGR